MRNFGDKLDNTAPNSSGILTADEDNVRFKELENAVSSSGIVLDGPTGPDLNLNMLAEALARYASGGIVCKDTGAANTHVLSSNGQFILPKAYFKDMLVVFYPAGTNTGAATANVSGIGAKQIYNSVGGALVAGDIAINTFTMMVYDPALNAGAGAFKLSPWSMPMRTVGDGTPVYEGLTNGRHKIRSLMAGSNITIDLVESPAASGEYKIRITSTGGGGGGTLTDGDKGDITVTSAGSVWTIDANVVSNGKLAQMAANSIKGRLSTIGDPQDLNGTQVMGILPDASSGTKGAVTPDGNVAHFLNGTGAFSPVPAGFPVYPEPGSYTTRLLVGTGATSYEGQTKNATGTGSWSSAGITLPSGVWLMITAHVIREYNGGNDNNPNTLCHFQRTA